MQETAIADGVGERLSLEGYPVFEDLQPYKKMPSWGGNAAGGLRRGKNGGRRIEECHQAVSICSGQIGNAFSGTKGLMIVHHKSFNSGAAGEIRTPGLQVRSLLLYPAELQPHHEKEV